MIDPIRSLIREDIEAGYQEPSLDLTRRALTVVAVRHPERRSTFQMLAVTVALLVIAAAVLIARGTHLLSVSQEGSGTGFRPPSASYSIVDNEFVSATTGWILIQMHTTSGPTVLLKTSDAGKHWVEQFRYSGQGGIDRVHFSRNGLDGTMSWIEGNAAIAVIPGKPTPTVAPQPTIVKTYQTHDGGSHWVLAFTTTQDNPPKTQKPPAYFPGGPQSFLDNDQEGWELQVSSDRSRNALVMHSTDAGRTWSQVGTLPGSSAPCELYFIDSQNGWCALSDSRTFAWDANGNPLPSATPSALLLVTHDGGHSWAGANLSLPAGANASDIDVRINQPVMFDAIRGLLVIQLIPAPPSPPNPANLTQTPPPQAQPASYVVTTKDGGNTWEKPVALPGGLDLGGAAFISPEHWLVGNRTFLMETSNGGKSWSSRRVLADGFNLSLTWWQPSDARGIWSQVGAGALIRSTDGGRTWEAVTPPTVH